MPHQYQRHCGGNNLLKPYRRTLRCGDKPAKQHEDIDMHHTMISPTRLPIFYSECSNMERQPSLLSLLQDGQRPMILIITSHRVNQYR